MDGFSFLHRFGHNQIPNPAGRKRVAQD